jgi:hypothetical protein
MGVPVPLIFWGLHFRSSLGSLFVWLVADGWC